MSVFLESESNVKSQLPSICVKCKKKTRAARFRQAKFANDLLTIRVCDNCRIFYVLEGYSVEVIH